MSRLISRAESWERVYEAFDTVNFAAFDYATVKQSLLDYIKLTFPESFNDFIESSELIAIVESFAYVAELIAYRVDVAAHENFLTTAQRKDSILRLAKLISYTASRPIPARGLVKITSVTTSESVFDTNGTQLAGRVIRWNDPSNPYWKEQFILVMNKVLDQEIGNVSPTDRFQIQDVLFELYSMKNTPLRNGVVSYSAITNGRAVPMELVPVEYNADEGIVERRPANNANFTILYGTDGMGDGSSTTGFFCFTKQGTMQKFTTTFDGVTPTQKYTPPVRDVNDIDVWVNQIDPATGETLDEEDSFFVRSEGNDGKSGEWVPVDIAHAQNITFNTNPRRNKYEVETRDNNQVRLVFGDGEFANIPGGTFDVWVRSSLDEDVLVSQAAVVDTPAAFSYQDAFNQNQTCNITFSLISTLQNASASETLEHIKSVAPAVYYTQDRMVNGKDYNVFPLQDPSILKLRAVNRTFAGDSKYIPWHDSSSTYEDVKIFGDDGVLYFEDQYVSETTPTITTNDLIASYIEPLLSSTDLYVRIVSETNATYIGRKFTPDEQQSIVDALSESGTPASASLYYKKTTGVWYAIGGLPDGTTPGANPSTDLAADGWVDGPTNPFISDALITIGQINTRTLAYDVSRAARRLTIESPTTAFWSSNDGDSVINYNSLRSENDKIVILHSNINHSRDAVLQRNWNYDVLGRAVIGVGSDVGLPNNHKLVVIPEDENKDTLPDSLTYVYPDVDGVGDIITPKIEITVEVSSLPYVVTLPIYYTPGTGDVSIYSLDDEAAFLDFQEDTGTVSNTITLLSGPVGPTLNLVISVTDYVYFTRYSTADDWEPAPSTLNSIYQYVADQATSTADTALWTRRIGRDSLNFMWSHTSPRYHLVDPSPTNIIDMFVITRGYYNELRRWLQDSSSASKPALPTPLDLRTSYSTLLENKMVSDTVVLHPGRVKLLFGDKAVSQLRGVFKVVRAEVKTMTDNQVKSTIVTTVRNFFDMTKWEFGETFYVTELLTAVHNSLRTEISSVVLVPTNGSSQFGDLFQIRCQEDEIFYCDIGVEDIEVVQSYTPTNIRLNG